MSRIRPVTGRHALSLRVHAFLPHSYANGPGRRAALWLQGCTLRCPGCYNPQTHDVRGGKTITVDEAFAKIASLGEEIEGVSVSGGEPFQQGEALGALLGRIRAETSLSTIVFTGYTQAEIGELGHAETILACTDVLLAGRYQRERHLARALRGSANKMVHLLSNRYTLADLQAVPALEVVIDDLARVVASGIDRPG